MICFCNRPAWRRKRRIFRKVLALVCLTALVNTRENTLGLFSRNRVVELLSAASIANSDLPLCRSWDGTVSGELSFQRGTYLGFFFGGRTLLRLHYCCCCCCYYYYLLLHCLAWKIRLGRLTWVRHESRKISAAYSNRCVQCFRVPDDGMAVRPSIVSQCLI